MSRVRRKWRPPLWFVLAGPLAAVFILPLLGIGYFRLAGGVLGWGETTWLIFWMALLAAVVLGYLLWRLVLRPVQDLTAFANDAQKRRESSVFPEHYGTPEFSQLGNAVAEMSRVLQGREAVVRSYADHVTHEMKSPLSAMKGAAELLEDPALEDADRVRLLGHIQEGLQRLTDLLDDQRTFARASEPLGAGQVDLSEIAEGYQVLNGGIVPLPQLVMEVVLTQLAGNAKDAGAENIFIELQEDSLKVWDDGPGISKGNRARIFDPFFTTRRGTGGTGMGLPIVRRMLEAHGAQITLSDGDQTVFVISW